MGAVGEAESLELAQECGQNEGRKESEVGEASLEHLGEPPFGG